MNTVFMYLKFVEGTSVKFQVNLGKAQEIEDDIANQQGKLKIYGEKGLETHYQLRWVFSHSISENDIDIEGFKTVRIGFTK